MGVRRDAEHNRRDARAPHFVLFHGPNAFQKEMEALHERLRSRRGNEAETIVSHKIRLVTSAATRFMVPMRAKFGVEASHELRSWGVQPSGCWAEGTLQRGLRTTSDSFKVTLHAKFDVQAINSCGSPSVHRLRSC